jgi:hypothetical protein
MLSYHARLSLEYFASQPRPDQTPATLARIVRHVAFTYAMPPASTASLLSEATAEAQRRGLVRKEVA